MPITSSAQKAHSASLKKRVFNTRRSRAMRDAVKSVRSLAAAGKTAEAEKELPAAYQAIDKAAKRGIIKDNTAARKKSRLTKYVAQSASKK